MPNIRVSLQFLSDAASMFKAVREVKIGECAANQALKKQPLAWYLKDKKDSSRAEFFVTAFVCVVCNG